MTITRKIIVAMILGLLVGLILNPFQNLEFIKVYIIDGLLLICGKAFIASLKLLVVPLVFVSLVCGTAALDDIKKLRRIGIRTLLLYLATTGLAITVAILIAIVVQPGQGFDLTASTGEFTAKPPPPLKEVLINIFPTNPIKAMAEGNMLQIIVFSGLLGVALTLSKSAGQKALAFFKTAETIILKMVDIIILLAPYGVFALLCKVFATEGLSAISPLLKYFSSVTAALLFHALVTYPLLLILFTGISPLEFFRRFRQVIVFAFSTSSSNATLPVTLDTVEKNLGVDNKIAAFTLPLGATINMDGTAIMQGVATGFIAQAYGIDIGLSGYLTVILTATLASIGTAGVPGVGLIMLAMVLKQVNLPVEGIALVIGVDRLLDMMRTAVNVSGDAIVTCIIAKGENAIKLPKKLEFE